MRAGRVGGTVVASPRLAERRRSVRSEQARRRRRAVASVLLVAGLAAGGWTFTRSTFFALTAIEVVGIEVLTAEEVIAAGGVAVGDSLLGIDGEAIGERIGRLERVQAVSVERDGTVLRIAVVERRPALVIVAEEQRHYLDADGRSLPAPPDPPEGIPVLRVAAAEGERMSLPGPGTARAVLAIWRAIPVDIQAEARWFEAPSRGEISLRLEETVVIFGSSDQAAEKVAALLLVRDRVAAEGGRLERVDVRVPGRPAARVGE